MSQHDGDVVSTPWHAASLNETQAEQREAGITKHAAVRPELEEREATAADNLSATGQVSIDAATDTKPGQTQPLRDVSGQKARRGIEAAHAQAAEGDRGAASVLSAPVGLAVHTVTVSADAGGASHAAARQELALRRSGGHRTPTAALRDRLRFVCGAGLP
jgi:hypothetical protein